ncbi:MAG: zinc ABC transporter substrate-binding protein, partial [Alphaproteobacteria bacterium]
MRQLLRFAVICAALILPAVAHAETKLNVVTSFSILADMARQIGGEHVAVKSLIGPDADAHTFSPAPGDVKTLGKAKVFIVNGLEFEGWAKKLVKSAGFKGEMAVAAKGVSPLKPPHGGHEHKEHAKAEEHDHEHKEHAKAEEHDHEHGHHHTVDPHAWQSVANGLIYAANIRDMLVKADPAHADAYKTSADRYMAELRKLDAWVKAEIAKVPEAKRKVITAHHAFQYFGHAYGVAFIAPEGVSSEAAPSAKVVAHIVDQIRREHITALFFENISDPRLIEQLKRDGGASIGGTLYSDAVSAKDGPAASYTAM